MGIRIKERRKGGKAGSEGWEGEEEDDEEKEKVSRDGGGDQTERRWSHYRWGTSPSIVPDQN